jgi:hypothetical protein
LFFISISFVVARFMIILASRVGQGKGILDLLFPIDDLRLRIEIATACIAGFAMTIIMVCSAHPTIWIPATRLRGDTGKDERWILFDCWCGMVDN